MHKQVPYKKWIVQIVSVRHTGKHYSVVGSYSIVTYMEKHYVVDPAEA